MANDNEQEERPVCGICMGAGGEWINQNGDSRKQSTWVSCESCSGTGRR
ncbi:hypothetical protein AB0J71_06980 [Nonomuraea sp. NPDC049637]